MTEFDKTAGDFAKTLLRYGENIQKDVDQVVRLSVLAVFRKIIERSPVDTGAYKASHGIVSGRKPGPKEGIKGETEGTKAALSSLGLVAEQAASLGWTWKLGDGVIWLFNNQPYAEVIEFGGYPKNPKKWSWDKKKKEWVVKSEGGYSKQAPTGVYLVSLAEYEMLLRQEIIKHGGTLEGL